MLLVQSLVAFRRCLDTLRTRCDKLIAMTCDTYRPELHYMRGPYPRWYAKHKVILGGEPLNRGIWRPADQPDQVLIDQP